MTLRRRPGQDRGFTRSGINPLAAKPKRHQPRVQGESQNAHGGDESAMDAPAQQDRFLPAPKVAAILGCTTRTLWTWEQRGILTPVRINTRRLYRLSDIQALTHGGSDDV